MTACAAVESLLEADPHPPISELRRVRRDCGCDRCRVDFSATVIRVVIEKMLRHWVSQDAPPSAVAPMLEQAMLSHGKVYGEHKQKVDEWQRHQSMERRKERMRLFAIIDSYLTPLQRALIVYAYTPAGSKIEDYEVSAGDVHECRFPLDGGDGLDAEGKPLLCRAPLKNGGECRNYREPGELRCKLHHAVTSAPATHATKDGAELQRYSQDGSTAIVRGHRTLMRSPDEIGELLAADGYRDDRTGEAWNGKSVTRMLSGLYEALRVVPQVGEVLALEAERL